MAYIMAQGYAALRTKMVKEAPGGSYDARWGSTGVSTETIIVW